MCMVGLATQVLQVPESELAPDCSPGDPVVYLAADGSKSTASIVSVDLTHWCAQKFQGLDLYVRRD